MSISEGDIAHWTPDNTIKSNHALVIDKDFNLISSNTAIQVKHAGLYLVYAQVH